MKKLTYLLLIVSPLISMPLAACSCEKPAPVATAETPAQGHPLKGVVLGVYPDQSALFVKHEEIPGVMKAMSMLLLVDAATLKSPAATRGAAITGLLVRKANGWWLEEVKVVE